MSTTLTLLTNPLSSVTVKRMVTEDASHNVSATFVQFEGRDKPTGFRSQAQWRVWDCEAVFARAEHSDANALLSLLTEAYSAADARLLMTTGRVNSLTFDSISPRDMVVEVHGWDIRREPGGIVRVRFQATEVSS